MNVTSTGGELRFTFLFSILFYFIKSRWNIYHYACEKNKIELLDFFLKKLPRDTSEMLLAQQSTGRLNTVSGISCLC